MTARVRKLSWQARTAIGCLAVAAFALVGISPAVPNTIPHFVLAAGTNFTVSSTITAWPACSGPTVSLYPGVTDCITYTVTNPLNAPITVTSLSATPGGLPAACPAALLDLSGGTFSGSLAVGIGQVATVSVPITMGDNGNQNACQSVNFTFSYSGFAQFTDSTSTVLVSSTNPSTVGIVVTFTATVTPGDPLVDTSTPSGTVSFLSCTTPACTTTALLGTGTLDPATGVATLSTSGLPLGTSFVEAVYGGFSTDFTGSSSNVVSQVVVTVPPPPTTAPTTTSTSTTSSTTTTTAPPTSPASSTTIPSSTTTGPPTAPSGGTTTTAPPTKAAGSGGLAFTGANIARLVIGGLALLVAGVLALGMARRRLRPQGSGER